MKKNRISKNWINKQRRDIYIRKSKIEGYRSRAAYKLEEINKKFKIFKNGFKIILKDPNVKAILINIFGGIVRCDRVAKGVVQAVEELNLDVPVVVRLEGTNAIEAKDILNNSEVEIIPATTMQDAADKVVNAALN